MRAFGGVGVIGKQNRVPPRRQVKAPNRCLVRPPADVGGIDRKDKADDGHTALQGTCKALGYRME